MTSFLVGFAAGAFCTALAFVVASYAAVVGAEDERPEFQKRFEDDST